MWCPEGYSTFREIYENLENISRSNRFNMRREGSVKTLFIGDHEKTILHDCVEEFASTCPSLAVVSPTGVTLRIDGRVMAHRFIPNAGWMFSFINQETGLLNSQQIDICIGLISPILINIRANIEHYDWTDEEIGFFDDGNHSGYPRVADGVYSSYARIEDDFVIWKSLERFEGWAICCRLEDLPTHPDQFLSMDGLAETYSKVSPPKDVTQSIIEAFDQGNLGSRDHFWHREFPALKREAFRAAWRDAAVIRPEISKIGPK